MTAISSFKPRDYQIDGVFDALRNNRRLIISPTGSGKSLMIYVLHVIMWVEKEEYCL